MGLITPSYKNATQVTKAPHKVTKAPYEVTKAPYQARLQKVHKVTKGP